MPSILRRSRPTQTPEQRARQDQLSRARSRLAQARVDYAMAFDTHATVGVIRHRYHRLSDAYRDAITAAMAVEHDRKGSARAELEELRRQRQRHLLAAPAGVLLPVSVRPRSNAAYGPLIPGIDFDPDDPMVGPPTGREFGDDLPALLDTVTARRGA